MLFDYDDSDIKSIYNYAKKLEKMTFNDVKTLFDSSLIKHYHSIEEDSNFQYDDNPQKELGVQENEVGYIDNINAKGMLGGFIERYYFGYKPNSKQAADFEKVGMELKQTCIDLTKKGEMRAGERLSITNISFDSPVIDDFYESHVWEKTKLILLIHYLRNKTIDKLDNQIQFVTLFTPSDADLKIIVDDYNTINKKIKDGKAHELSESDTLYLGACTKGSTALGSMRPQYYGDHTPAKSRNFCFKQSYMNFILQDFILKRKSNYESIIKNKYTFKDESFEGHILNLITQYVGKTDEELCGIFNKKYDNNKSQWTNLAFNMLGIKGNQAEEFEKANIVVKTIRIESTGKINENMSFPPFKFKELMEETWEESFLYNYFEETKFLFVIYKSDGKHYKLVGSQFWNMPSHDLNITVRTGWENIKNSIENGVTFTPKKSGNKTIYKNSLPKKGDNPILHIRPHAAKAAYKLNDGTLVGNLAHANELPDGQWMTTQSFWINNTYLLTQLDLKKILQSK